MWTLLQPVFLWASFAAVIPLLLHLLRRRRSVKIPFSTLRFLKLARQRSSSRIRMEHFFLWLLRTLLVLVIVLAFAGPVLRTVRFGSLIGAARRDIALVLDVSYSMGYETGRRSVWEDARAAAEAVVQGLTEGDRVCVFLADDTVRPLVEQPTGDREMILGLLKDLAPGPGSSRLLPALRAATDALRETGGREREIHVLTDGQALAWRPLGGGAAAGAGAEVDRDPDLHIFVTLLGARAPRNAFPRAAEIRPPLLRAGQPARLAADIEQQGAAQPLTVTLFIDGEEAGRRETGGTEGRERVSFLLAPLDEGVHQAWIETPGDGLAADNRFYLLLHSRARLPVLCVGTPEDRFFVERALSPGGVPLFDVRTADAAGLADEPLAGMACVFLCNIAPLPGPPLLTLERYVRDGGVAMVFPGDRGLPSDYDSWSCLPARPERVEDVADPDRGLFLRAVNPADPVLAALAMPPGSSPVLHARRLMRFGAVEADGEVLIDAGDGLPVLLRRTFGEGRVFLCAAPADRSWSSLPLAPYFLPLVHQVAVYAAGTVQDRLYETAGPALELPARLLPPDAPPSVRRPDGRLADLRYDKDAAPPRYLLEDARQPGVYRRDGEPPVPVAAVNASVEESDLAPLDPRTLAGLVDTGRLYTASGFAELQQLIADLRLGKPAAEFLLWLALILAVLEWILANRMSRSAPTLTGQLHVDEAGRVRGAHPAAAEGGGA